MLINNTSYKITGVVFRSFFQCKTITGLIKTRPATPLFSEIWVFVLELIFDDDGLTSKLRRKSYTIITCCCISTFDGCSFLPRSAAICFPPPDLWVSSAASPVGKKLVLTHCCQQDAHCKHTRGTCESAGQSHMLWNCGKWHLMCMNEDRYQCWALHMRREINHKNCCYLNAFITVLVHFLYLCIEFLP